MGGATTKAGVALGASEFIQSLMKHIEVTTELLLELSGRDAVA
jgi:hypothetical protein